MNLVGENHPVLLSVAQPVTAEELADPGFKQGMQKFKQAAEDERGGVGLAAPQVGIGKRFFVYRENHDQEFRWVINPKIHPFGKEVFMLEGCLSLPGYCAEVLRPESIKYTYQTLNEDNKIITVSGEANDFEARVMQHENDHLNGKLYTHREIKNLMKEEEYRTHLIKSDY